MYWTMLEAYFMLHSSVQHMNCVRYDIIVEEVLIGPVGVQPEGNVSLDCIDRFWTIPKARVDLAG